VISANKLVKNQLIKKPAADACMNNPVVCNHWTGLLDWNTGMDYWTDIFLDFKHIAVVVLSLIESFWL